MLHGATTDSTKQSAAGAAVTCGECCSSRQHKSLSAADSTHREHIEGSLSDHLVSPPPWLITTKCCMFDGRQHLQGSVCDCPPPPLSSL